MMFYITCSYRDSNINSTLLKFLYRLCGTYIVNLNFGWVQHDDWCIYSSIINIIKCIDDTNLVGLNLAHPHNAPSHDKYTAHKPIQLSSSLPATDSLHLPLPALHLLGQQVWHLRRGPLIRPPLKGAPQKISPVSVHLT